MTVSGIPHSAGRGAAALHGPIHTRGGSRMETAADETEGGEQNWSM